jgi:DNA (cytosine-5)-methyltransferase 1
MKSSNPHSGVYVADTMRTLDLNGGNPACNQGGVVVVQEAPVICLQGNMIGRQEKNGPQGDGINEDISYTLNATDQHAVVIPINTMVGTRGGDERRTCLGIGNDDDPQYTLSAEHSHAVMMYEPYQHHGYRESDICGTLTGGQNDHVRGDTPLVFDARGNGNGRICPTLTGDHQSRVTDYTALCIGNSQTNQGVSPTCGTLNCMHDSQAVIVSPDVAHALKAKVNCDYRADSETYIAQYGIARRLTPLECERLQGFPDGWTDIGDWTDSKGKRRKAADTPRYKALGNAIALPFWEWLAERMTWQLKLSGTLNPTMGSLFDGIGGFPLAFSRAGAVPVWASEIEEFAIAVTKTRFPETERKEKKSR